MARIFVTRKIPEAGPKRLRASGHEVVVSEKDGVLTKEELIAALRAAPYDAVLCLLTDKIDDQVLAAAPQAKIFANYAVGVDNVDLAAAKKRGIIITNTPGVLTNSVAEHTFALMMAVAKRLTEADRFTRAGEYRGWAPELFLGVDLTGKTLGIIGLGRIGARVAHHGARGFEMKIIYYDVTRNEQFEKDYQAEYKSAVDQVLSAADFVSIHVPLLDSTKHLINEARLQLMKPTAILVNTSRGPVVDETALVAALEAGTIRGAALDVFECEPAIDCNPFDHLELKAMPNVILTPHTASATGETRQAMSRLAAENILAALEGKPPPNLVK